MDEDHFILRAEGIVKRFGGVTALAGIDFSMERGEVVGLVGDNGAGKSTFIKILSGAFQPDAGEIYFNGQKVRIENPAFARRLGIETVYQNLALVERMSAAANIFLGREPIRFSLAGIKFVDKRRMERESQLYLERLGIALKSVRSEARSLSGGERQSVAICRAIFTSPKLVLMDEPTAALAVREVEMVLNLINKLKGQGIAVIVISHTLPHVFEVADRIVVFRHGRKVLDTKISETDMNEVVKHITGA